MKSKKAILAQVKPVIVTLFIVRSRKGIELFKGKPKFLHSQDMWVSGDGGELVTNLGDWIQPQDITKITIKNGNIRVKFLEKS